MAVNENNIVVPICNSFFPNIDELSIEQKEFYYFFRERTLKGKRVDINGNVSYVYLLAYELLGELTDKVFEKKGRNLNKLPIKKLVSQLTSIRLLYCHKMKGGSKYAYLNYYLTLWTSDIYVLIGDYDSAWRILRETRLSLEDILCVLGKSSNKHLIGKDIINFARYHQGITRFVIDQLDRLEELMTQRLNAFHFAHGENIIDNFISKFSNRILEEHDLMEIKEYYINEKDYYSSLEEYKYWVEHNYKDKDNINFAQYRQLFSMLSDFKHYSYDRKKYYHGIKYNRVPSILRNALEDKLKRMLRMCENQVRVENSIPKVGEGWISETYLFYQLKEKFPAEKIIQHGKPHWLNKQHLDIYFPERKIGIEYQGKQHFEPVEYFGGVEAYKKQIDRDNEKRIICENNDCHIIYVNDKYDINDVVNNIIYILKK